MAGMALCTLNKACGYITSYPKVKYNFKKENEPNLFIQEDNTTCMWILELKLRVKFIQLNHIEGFLPFFQVDRVFLVFTKILSKMH